MKGWERARQMRQAEAKARAAGGQLVGQPTVIARLLVAILNDGTAQVAMPGDIDSQFALIGRALTAAVVNQIKLGGLAKDEQEEPKQLPEPTQEQLEAAE